MELVLAGISLPLTEYLLKPLLEVEILNLGGNFLGETQICNCTLGVLLAMRQFMITAVSLPELQWS